MNRPTLYMMIGLPSSGKSTYAQRLIRDHKNSIIFSSDELRKELFGDINNQDHNAELFVELHKRIKSALILGKYNYVVYDATNINSRRRAAFLREIESINCYKVAIVMATPYEVCLRQNWSRERKIPDDVIKRMYMSWQTPAYFEGWDNIQVELWSDISRRNAFYHWMSTLKFVNYNQNNPHHSETLGNHLLSVGHYVENKTKDDNVIIAAFLHDIGKSFCRTIDDNDIAHYYGHENVGAYDVLCAAYGIEISLLINLHMRPLSWHNDCNLHDKYKKLWGEDLYNKVMLIYDADIIKHNRI